MNYNVKFPNTSLEKRFEKTLKTIQPKNLQLKIINEVEKLSVNPYPEGKKFKILKPPVILFEFTAQCRIRIGDYRVLYDVDEKTKTVWILVLRKRNEKTYQ